MGDDLTVSVAHSRVGAVGPIVEAVADANGLRVEIPALDAFVPSAGLEGSPSRVWTAIGRAVFEFGLQSGQSAHQLDPFTYVRVVDGDGPRVAEVALPSLHPTGAMPSDFSPTKYDDWDWHTGGEFPADRDPDQAFVHIGMYLTWIIRHDMLDSSLVAAQTLRDVKNGRVLGTELRDDVDGQLVSDMLSADGQAFTDGYYASHYLADWDQTFGDTAGDYSVPDTWATYGAIEPVIDQAYAGWVAAGRPGPALRDAAEPTTADLAAIEVEDVEITEMQVGDLPRAHVDPDLEGLLPHNLTDPPLDLSSVSATAWGSSRLNATLRRLGVRPRDATVASAVGGSGSETIMVSATRVPAVDASTLQDAFRASVFLERGARWTTREIGERTVDWAQGPQFGIAVWVEGDVAFHFGGEAGAVEAAVSKLKPRAE
jgi:hypothetical protein